MENTHYRANLDVHKTGHQWQYPCKVGDTARELWFTISDRNKPLDISGYTALLKIKRPSGTELLGACIMREYDNVIIYQFTAQTAIMAGIHECELMLVNSEAQVVYSPTFCLNVLDTVYGDVDIIDANDFSELHRIIAQANNLDVSVVKDNGFVHLVVTHKDGSASVATIRECQCDGDHVGGSGGSGGGIIIDSISLKEALDYLGIANDLPDVPGVPPAEPEEPDPGPDVLVRLTIVYNDDEVESGTRSRDLNIAIKGLYSVSGEKLITSGYSITPAIVTTDNNVITVAYDGKYATYTVPIKAEGPAPVDVLNSITLSYNGGEVDSGTSTRNLDITVVGHYSLSGEKVITSGYNISPDVVTSTSKTVTVYYQGKTASVSIPIKAPTATDSLQRIRLVYNGGPVDAGTKTATLDLTVIGVYEIAGEKVIEDGYTLSPSFISDINTTVTVTYKGFTASVDIPLNAGVEQEDTLQFVSVIYNGKAVQPGTKTNTLDITVNAVYTVSGVVVVSNGYTITPTTITEEENKITVTYNGKTGQCTIPVIPSVPEPEDVLHSITLQYLGGEVASGTSVSQLNIRVTGHYSVSGEKLITYGYERWPDVVTTAANTVTISYQGKTASVNIPIKAEEQVDSLLGIKAVYNGSTVEAGTNTATLDIAVTGIYKISGEQPIAGYALSPSKVTDINSKVTVTYKGFTATVDIPIEPGVEQEDVLTFVSVIYNGDAVFSGTSVSDLDITVNGVYTVSGVTEIKSGYAITPSTVTDDNHIISVTYQGVTGTCNIPIKQPVVETNELTGISVVYTGGAVDSGTKTADLKSKMTVTAHYSLSGDEVITSGYTIYPSEVTTDNNEIIVAYKQKAYTLTIPIKAAAPVDTLESISVTYSGGEVESGTAVNSLGLVIKANYSVSGQKTITSGYTVSPSTVTTSSNRVTVTYNGKTAYVDIPIKAEAVDTLQSISVTYNGGTVPSGTRTDSLDITVKANYSLSGQKTITSGYTLSPATVSTWSRRVTVSYGGKSASFTVTIGSAAQTDTLQSIRVVYNGDPVDGSASTSSLDITVYGTYSLTGEKVIESGYAVSPARVSNMANILTVTYSGLSATVEIPILGSGSGGGSDEDTTVSDDDKFKAVYTAAMREIPSYDAATTSLSTALTNGNGNCLALCEYVKIGCDLLGIPCEILYGTSDPSSISNMHTWNRVVLDGTNYWCDLTSCIYMNSTYYAKTRMSLPSANGKTDYVYALYTDGTYKQLPSFGIDNVAGTVTDTSTYVSMTAGTVKSEYSKNVAHIREQLADYL